MKSFIIVWLKWNIVNIFKKGSIFYNKKMFSFNELIFYVIIFMIINQKNNILFLFWTTLILTLVIVNFYFNYRIRLISILTRFVFIRRLLVFFIYSILLFYNNFSYDKNNKFNIFLVIRFLYIFLRYYKNTNFSWNIRTIFLDFNNWWVFIIITFTFLFLIFLCFSVSKEKFI